jgi:hypothetical protein
MTPELIEQMEKEYQGLVTEWLERTKYPMSEKSARIAAKILMHRDRMVTYPAGHFITAFLDNDFISVMSRADDDTMANLVYIYRAWYNIDSFHIAHKYRRAQQETLDVEA